ncbi:Imm52 family immunity protein [Streptomyces sp. NPDC001970]
MLYVVVNAFWGMRQESVERIAERWAETLTALDEMEEASLSGWLEAADDLSSAPAVPSSSVHALAEYIERGNQAPDIPRIGYTSSLLTNSSGMPRVTLAIHAGGTSEYVTNSVSLSFRSPRFDESFPAVRRAADILRILADVWDPDAGQVYGRPQNDAVKEEFGLAASDPRCGRSVHLSARRAALVPDDLPGTYTRTAHDGLVIDLTRGGTVAPDIEAILEANRKLRAAGALEPLPVPFDRPKW